MTDLSNWPIDEASVPDCPPMPYPDKHVDWHALHSKPIVDPTAWIAPDAIVNGRVRVGARSSIWHGCICRGDSECIDIGSETNVQDGSILHVDAGFPCVLRDRVSLGHRAIVHASVVDDGALIAIAATVLSRCHIGEGALIAAGAVVREGTRVPPHTLWAGVPARKIGELTDDQKNRLAHTWQHYVNQTAARLARGE